MKHSKIILMLAAGLVASGCYTTTVSSGKPAAEAPLEADQHWHLGFLGGTEEASGPYDLDKICPNGWSEIRTETSFANGLVEFMSMHIYSPQTVDVKCAAPESRGVASAK